MIIYETIDKNLILDRIYNTVLSDIKTSKEFIISRTPVGDDPWINEIYKET